MSSGWKFMKRHASNGIQDRANLEKSLRGELEELLRNPEAELILLNDWLHYETLSQPSFELIQYIAFRLLTGGGIVRFAAAHSRDQVAAKILEELRKETAEERDESISRTLRRLESFRFFHTGKKGALNPHVHEWLPILWPYLYPPQTDETPESITYAHGARAIARGIVEAMIHRALFRQDSLRLEGLAVAIQVIRDNAAPQPTNSNRIAGEILRFLPSLSEELERSPSKSEIEQFLLEVLPGRLSERREDWTVAFRKIGYPADLDRRSKSDSNQILKIARKYKVGSD